MSYDVIVVGCGLGGLSAAALLAKAGRKVLAVERQDGVGGCGHAFRRGEYLFDPAIHVLEEAREGRYVDLVLRHLGVRDEVDLIRVEDLCRIRFPGLELKVPSGHEAVVDAHIEALPEEAGAVRAFFDLHRRFFHEASHLSMSVSPNDLDRMVEQFPVFFKYRNATLGAVLDECFLERAGEGRVQRDLAVSRAAAVAPGLVHRSRMLTGVLIDGGAYYCRGSFQRLADAFVTALERDGGELILDEQVSRILVEDGRAQGIRLADGTELRAPVVISNADARHTLEELVGVEQLPPRLRAADWSGWSRRSRPSSCSRRRASTCVRSARHTRRSSTSTGITRTRTATSSRAGPAACGRTSRRSSTPRWPRRASTS